MGVAHLWEERGVLVVLRDHKLDGASLRGDKRSVEGELGHEEPESREIVGRKALGNPRCINPVWSLRLGSSY